MSGPELIYWDSDAFLGWLQEEQDKVELCKGPLERAKAGEVLIVTSALTIAEVLWRRRGPRLPKDKAEILRRFFRHSYIRVRNVTRAIAESAQDVVWNHGVMPKDAIHVATALDAGAAVLETFDAELLKRTGMVGSPPLLIRKPIPPKEPSLPL
jgi:predicted nucleic acid-binding protein